VLLKIAFYKGNSDSSFISRVKDFLIRKWTKGPYSHCEIVLEENWYSADSRNNIVRKESESNINPQDKWDYLKFLISEESSEQLKTFFEKEEGKKYDWKGIIFSQILPLKKHDHDKWFCSELCVHLLSNIDFFFKESPEAISPNRLYDLLKFSREEKSV
jgi:hypothetical protein